MRNLLGQPTVTYCERAISGLIKRPWSALSNVGFLLAGAAILIHGRGSKLSKQFGWVAIAVGVASTFYDASFTYGSQLIDLFMMLVFINLLLHLNFTKLGMTNNLKWLAASIVIAIVAIILIGSYAGDFVFGIYVVAVIVSELILMKR